MNSDTPHVMIWEHEVSCQDISDMASEISRSSSKQLSIEFRGHNLTVDLLEHLCKELDDTCQIVNFAVSYMNDVRDLLEKICFIVKKYKATSLSLEYDELNDDSVKLIEDYLKDADNLESLDISYNNNIGSRGFRRLGEIMRKFSITSITAIDCDITNCKLENFLDALQDFKLKDINLGYNTELSIEAFRTLGKFVSKKGTDRLELSGCRLSKERMETFHTSLTQTGHQTLIQELDLSYNKLEPDNLVGKVVVKCGVTKLSMAGCRLETEHLVILKKSIGEHEMDLINLQDNVSIGEGITEIAELVKQCKVKELNISDCMFTPRELEKFGNALNEAKVESLHLGDKTRDPDTNYVKKLCELLKNVEKVLYIRFYKLSKYCRFMLQAHYRNTPKINLTVDFIEEKSNNKRNIDETKSLQESRTSSTMPQLEDFEIKDPNNDVAEDPNNDAAEDPNNDVAEDPNNDAAEDPNNDGTENLNNDAAENPIKNEIIQEDAEMNLPSPGPISREKKEKKEMKKDKSTNTNEQSERRQEKACERSSFFLRTMNVIVFASVIASIFYDIGIEIGKQQPQNWNPLQHELTRAKTEYLCKESKFTEAESLLEKITQVPQEDVGVSTLLLIAEVAIQLGKKQKAKRDIVHLAMTSPSDVDDVFRHA